MHHRHDVTSATYLRDGVEGFSLPPAASTQELAAVAMDLKERLARRPS
jgi:histidine triad (HIT) family protein